MQTSWAPRKIKSCWVSLVEAKIPSSDSSPAAPHRSITCAGQRFSIDPIPRSLVPGTARHRALRCGRHAAPIARGCGDAVATYCNMTALAKYPRRIRSPGRINTGCIRLTPRLLRHAGAAHARTPWLSWLTTCITYVLLTPLQCDQTVRLGSLGFISK